MQIILGLAILLAPFLLLTSFKDKKLGFAYTISFLMAFHLFTAVLTQAFHIFTYPVIISVNIALLLVILFKLDFKKLRVSLDLSLFKRIDWILIFVLIIAFFHLYSVHYNYSGKFTIATSYEYQEAKKMRYPYPYFSDEWDAVALIQSSIETHSLPLKNPYTPEEISFINLELPFHSFLSEIALLLKLNPLVHYSVIGLVANLLVVVLIYLLLAINKVGKLSAAIASLSILYITNGANLPGLWYLLPLNLGIITLLLGFIFISSGSRKMLLFISFITLLFYPPLVVFYTAAFLGLVLRKDETLNKKVLFHAQYFVIVLGAGFLISIVYVLAGSSSVNFVDYIGSKIFYPSFTQNAIPSYAIYNVIPIPIILLSIIGIPFVFKKRLWLFSMLVIGATYWLVYSFMTFRFIIDYQRLVVVTSLIISVVAGFGLNRFQNYSFINYILIVILLLFVPLSFNYTKSDIWQKLELVDIEKSHRFRPSAPANKYLHPDDLLLFKDINYRGFLSIPWKGKVIGVATNNYPINIKAGTVTIGENELTNKFINSNCISKNELARSNYMYYIYLPSFTCPDFELVGSSSEGLYLYRNKNVDWAFPVEEKGLK